MPSLAAGGGNSPCACIGVFDLVYDNSKKAEKENSGEKRQDSQFIDDIRQNSAEHKLQYSIYYPKETGEKLHKYAGKIKKFFRDIGEGF
mgnify:FL=1